ncbi:hypothetical protein ABMA27_011171 [Loxostege sticticalis]|uniref:Ribosomal RNA processing protein 1 homolog n=1 Tax=Loxostege sticticalis TaxID=481309 RepID=A0ABR3H1I3_LOXSC
MKTVNKIKEKKRKTLKKPKVKNKKEKVLIVAQEIKFARLLSGNEKKTRDRVLKTFKKWLLNCFERGYEFKEDDFTRVWKGLFYAVWMSDKPLVQEELCETIAGILDLFPPEQVKYALLMTKAGFKVLATEWFGIDHHRMDKFLMLVRRYLRGSLRVVRRCGWKLPACKAYADMLSNSDGVLCARTPLYARNAGSMLMHVVDCFLEELAKVSEGEIPSSSVTELLRPFCAYMCAGNSTTLCVACRRLLTELLRQTDHGLQYRERTRAWQQMGCPRGGPDALEPASDDEEHNGVSDDEYDDDEDGEKPLDPRAGRVDVTLHPVPVDAAGVARTLRELLATAGSKAHKRTKICLQRFEQLAKDEYPLKVEDVYSDEEVERPKPGRAAKELKALEKKLVAASDELALRGLSRKHRKRVLAKSRAGVAIVSEPDPDITSTNGDWAVEATESKTAEKKQKKHKLDNSNKENVHKDRNAKKPKLTDKHADKRKDKTQKHGNKHKVHEKNKLSTDNKKVQNKSKEKIEIKSQDKMANKTCGKQEKLDNKSNDTQQNKSSERLQNKSNEKLQNKSNEQENKSNEKQQNKSNDKLQVKSNLQENKSNEKLQTKSNEKLQNKSNEKVKNVEIVAKQKVKLQEKNINNKLPTKDHKKNEKIQTKVEVKSPKKSYDTPKKVKFVLKNNSMQGPIDYYKSVRQSPNIPHDGSKKPTKSNLKPSTPSPLNPFAKKKLRLK